MSPGVRGLMRVHGVPDSWLVQENESNRGITYLTNSGKWFWSAWNDHIGNKQLATGYAVTKEDALEAVFDALEFLRDMGGLENDQLQDYERLDSDSR